MSAPSIPNFELLRRIGGGSYGEVWLGRAVTGVLRAVKIIERARFEDDRPFFRELEGITRFQHALGDQPRQLALLHVGRDEAAGLLYYVMELADDATTGSIIDPDTYVPLTLKELRARRRALPASDCVRVGAELAAALAELHDAGLLHRDVKPSNVIFVHGRAKLADIGLIASAEYTVSSVGTPQYAPPEGSGSVRADLYSLGKILYELSTGLHPDEFPRLPADLQNRPDADAVMELNEIVLRACHVDPEQRYPDAGSLLSDLRLLQAGRSVQELNRTRRQLRALSRAAAVAGAGALAVIAVLGARNYFAWRRLAAQEAAFRRVAESNERLALYTSDLHFAQLALTGGDIGAARTALRRQIPAAGASDLRGLEWFALWHRSEGEAARTFGEVGGEPVTSIALSDDGRSAVLIQRATPNHAVLLDLTTGARRPLAADCYGLAAFNSKRARLLATRNDLSLDAIDVATHQRNSLNVRGILLDLSPDGHRVLFAHDAPFDDTLFLWDADNGSTVFEWRPAADNPGATFGRAAATNEGRLIAASLSWGDTANRPDEVVIRNAESQAEIMRIRDLPRVGRLRFSPDGRRLAIVTATGVHVAYLDEGTTAPMTDAGSVSDAVEFSPDSAMLAIGGQDGLLTIWTVDDGSHVASFAGHELAILALQWSADGRRIITGGLDGTCRVWLRDANRGQTTLAGLWSGELGSVVLSSDGRTLAVTDGKGAVISLDTARLAPLRTYPAAFHPLAYIDADAGLLSLSADHQLLHTRSGNAETRTTGLTLPGDSQVTAFAVSANARFVAFGRASGEVQTWDLEARTELGWPARCAVPIRAVALTNDGACLAVSDRDGNLLLVTRSATTTLPTNAALVTSLEFSGDGTLLAGGNERGQLVVWDWRKRKIVAQLQAHSAEIRALAFTPDQSRIISGGADGLMVIWMTGSWRWLAAWLPEPATSNAQHGIYRLAIDHTGSWLAALTENGELHRWDCRPQTFALSETDSGATATSQ